jgi:hypothetical protein
MRKRIDVQKSTDNERKKKKEEAEQKKKNPMNNQTTTIDHRALLPRDSMFPTKRQSGQLKGVRIE